MPAPEAAMPRKAYLVSSRATFREFSGLARSRGLHRDPSGTKLFISEIDATRLEDVAGIVHRTEQRCGGFFAFQTREEAEAFLRSDRSAQAISAARASYAVDNRSTVDYWLPQVRESRIRDTIAHLSSYQNRYYASPAGKASAEWIRDSWAALAAGRSDVTTELFTACATCSTQPSVVLTIEGTTLREEVVVLGAHLDSINAYGGGSPGQAAPGADDDASGIAVLTETLRIALASGWRPQRTVKFMGYAAEEVGLRGSNAIAQSHRQAGVGGVAIEGTLPSGGSRGAGRAPGRDQRLRRRHPGPGRAGRRRRCLGHRRADRNVADRARQRLAAAAHGQVHGLRGRRGGAAGVERHRPVPSPGRGRCRRRAAGRHDQLQGRPGAGHEADHRLLQRQPESLLRAAVRYLHGTDGPHARHLHLRLRLLRPRLVDQRRIPGRDDVRGRRPRRVVPLHPHHRRHARDDGRYRAAERQVRAVRTGVPGRNGQDPRHAYRRPAVAAGQALTRRDPAMPPRGDRRRIVRALRTCSRPRSCAP